ncbi:hypothetical protein HMPREF0621_1943 [Pasteurella dagmatis ATCC 43325]|uniref:Uncharacterized protein n=1 Tax=Pasteurella dagmatis ATCC 43325 TaxID=667128 RepID=C9PSG9_9PAST|nr:hypothetical protein HMPREF0621_1943 [Pasteurella dagmatis ATCC 43325]
MSDQITPKVRNKTPICETGNKYRHSRFNALKHGGYATHFHALTEEEKRVYWEKKWK